MFCGLCANEDDKDSEIIIRNPSDSRMSQRVRGGNRSEIMDAVSKVAQFSMMRPSHYDEYLQNCKEKKILFEDPEFPRNQKSVGIAVNRRTIVWKRVTEIVKGAVMVQNSIEPGDVQQGNVGDCYFLASISSIAEDANRIKKIFCNDDMILNPYGIYRLQVASQGVLKEIVIDDYIPVFEGSNRPVFCKPKNNEVWVMLLEKAWAKLSGSYGNTSSGYPHEVLNTFLEAPCSYHEIPVSSIRSEEEKDELWKNIHDADKNGFVMCAGSRQAHVCQGIKPAHTYSLLSVYEVKADGQMYKLLKLRNPWGDTEYKGKFSEYDEPFWSKVDPMLKLAIFKKKNEDDGIFTIELNEFLRNFQSLDISHYRKDYNYIFQKVHAKSNHPFYFDLEVTESAIGEFYITIEKEFDRNSYINERRVDYGYSRLLIAQVREKVVGEVKKKEYIYVSSKLETNFPDLTIRCTELKKGNYIIFGETGFPGQKEGSITLSVYCKSPMVVSKIEVPDKLFLHKVFIDHANRYTQNRIDIPDTKNDWTISRFLFEAGGFGYIMASIGEKSKNKIKVICDLKKIYNSGFIILERAIREHKGSIEAVVGENEQSIFIFGIDFSKPIREVDFPPKGVKITRIV